MINVVITLTNSVTDYDLMFELVDIPIAHRWLTEVKLFVEYGSPWDDPFRFYNFQNNYWTHDRIVNKLKKIIDIINNHAPGTIDIVIVDSVTQDQLNYLHSIFEKCHGLYDQQQTNHFFTQSPGIVRSALSDLNIFIHRYESLGDIPRFVATWYGKPQRQPILDSDFKHFTLVESWGDLRLNYCEIGKHLYDLWHDNDNYVSADAFKPQHWFSFDFTVRFTSKDPTYYTNIENLVWDYVQNNLDMFNRLGYSMHDPKLALGGITVAKLKENSSREEIIYNIDQHQQLKSIKII
jgi:hypothetical protein